MIFNEAFNIWIMPPVCQQKKNNQILKSNIKLAMALKIN